MSDRLLRNPGPGRDRRRIVFIQIAVGDQFQSIGILVLSDTAHDEEIAGYQLDRPRLLNLHLLVVHYGPLCLWPPIRHIERYFCQTKERQEGIDTVVQIPLGGRLFDYLVQDFHDLPRGHSVNDARVKSLGERCEVGLKVVSDSVPWTDNRSAWTDGDIGSLDQATLQQDQYPLRYIGGVDIKRFGQTRGRQWPERTEEREDFQVCRAHINGGAEGGYCSFLHLVLLDRKS